MRAEFLLVGWVALALVMLIGFAFGRLFRSVSRAEAFEQGCRAALARPLAPDAAPPDDARREPRST